jgi:aminotransferase in exopolysaccharide biosynthesis
MFEAIPLSVPVLKGNEWQYVKDCLDTGWVSSVGAYVERFEREFCAYTGAGHAVACVNGTAALQVALRIVGVLPGDEVIVPTLTFIAPVNAIHYLGAQPILMDCDDYYNLDVAKTLEFIERETRYVGGHTVNRQTGRRIAALIPVHVFGNAVALDALTPLCQERNIRIVEDATESLGTWYTAGAFAGKHAGTLGNIGCFSFNGNKIITTGGGGMIVTDNPDHAEKARYLTTQAKDDGIHYIHHEVGYNYRLTNLQAAVGVAQLEQLPAYVETKRRNYQFYKQRIDAIPGLGIAEVPEYAANNCWMYALQIDRARYGMNREELMQSLGAQGIQTRPVWQLNHWQRPYRDCQGYRIEKAPELLERTLNIPCSVDLSASQRDRVIEALRRA